MDFTLEINKLQATAICPLGIYTIDTSFYHRETCSTYLLLFYL